MCDHRLRPDGLTCQRHDPHDPEAAGGHVYHSTSGVADRHTESSGE